MNNNLIYKYCIDCGRENDPPYHFRNCKSCMAKVKARTSFNTCQRCNSHKKYDNWGLCPKCAKDIERLNQEARIQGRKD